VVLSLVFFWIALAADCGTCLCHSLGGTCLFAFRSYALWISFVVGMDYDPLHRENLQN